MKIRKKIFKVLQAVFFSLILSISIIGLGYIHKPKASAQTTYTIQSGYYTFNEIIDFNTFTGFNFLDIYFNEDVTTMPFYVFETDGAITYTTIDSISVNQSSQLINFNDFNTTYIVYQNQSWQYEILAPSGSVGYIPVQTYTLYIPETFITGAYEYNWFMTNTNGLVGGGDITNEDIYNNGFDNGYNAGYNAGLQVGDDESYNAGYNAGIEYGSSLSYNDGYNAGYNAGVQTSSYSFLNLFTAVIDAPVKVFSQFLNFDFLGFNVWNFIKSIIGLAIVIFVLKLIIGRFGGTND